MPRLFSRILQFKIEGEIYDAKETSPESIIRCYEWSFYDNNDGSFSITGKHKDQRGRISKMIKLPQIYKCKTPDPEFFINM